MSLGHNENHNFWVAENAKILKLSENLKPDLRISSGGAVADRKSDLARAPLRAPDGEEASASHSKNKKNSQTSSGSFPFGGTLRIPPHS